MRVTSGAGGLPFSELPQGSGKEDTWVNLTNGQTVGIVFDVKAVELDTFSNDTSTAHGAQGLTIPVSAIWYNITATGSTPVQFQFESSTRPASMYD